MTSFRKPSSTRSLVGTSCVFALSSRAGSGRSSSTKCGCSFAFSDRRSRSKSFRESIRSDRAPSPLARFERLEKLEWLHAGLSKLSERDRTAIRLRDLDGLSIAETADALAISKAAAKSTHFRARKRLAYALQDASRPVVVDGCRAPVRSGKHSVRNTTAAAISINRGY